MPPARRRGGPQPVTVVRFGVEWKRRGRLQEELLETLLLAWTGEPFAYRGRTVRVTPRPLTEPHPPLLIGGSWKAAARRAAEGGVAQPHPALRVLPALGD